MCCLHVIFGLAAAAAAIAQLCAHRDGIDQIFATDSDAAADETAVSVSAVKSIAAVPSLSSAAAAVPSISAQTKTTAAGTATGTNATGTTTGTTVSGTATGTTATGTPIPTPTTGTGTGSSAMLAASPAEHHVLAHAIAYISQAARTHKSKSASANGGGGGGGDSATELRFAAGEKGLIQMRGRSFAPNM
jgi:hypothetical protein